MIYYVGKYADEQNEAEYKGAVPTKLKMNYVVKSFDEMSLPVTVFSMCSYKGKKLCSKSKKHKISQTCDIQYLTSFSEKFKMGSIVNRIFIKLQLIFFLLFTVKKGDVVLIYHAYSTLSTIKKIHSIKKFKWIAEIEELYSYAWNQPKIREKEMRWLKSADGYMCVNDVIAQYFKQDGKKTIISHGAYIAPALFPHDKNDDINVVYAGTIEKYKMGAFTAVESAKYLADNRKMHILGFGKEEIVEELKHRIDEINEEAGTIKVQYHGKKFGDELFSFLQSCDIGLSSNIMEADFANHTFPSKAITYVANNLIVVTGYAKMFETSKIEKYLRYFYEYDPKKIAEVINSLDKSELNVHGRDRILELHVEFKEQILDLLS